MSWLQSFLQWYIYNEMCASNGVPLETILEKARRTMLRRVMALSMGTAVFINPELPHFADNSCLPNSSFGGHGHQLLRKGKESERYSRSFFVVLKFPEVEFCVLV